MSLRLRFEAILAATKTFHTAIDAVERRLMRGVAHRGIDVMEEDMREVLANRCGVSALVGACAGSMPRSCLNQMQKSSVNIGDHCSSVVPVAEERAVRDRAPFRDLGPGRAARTSSVRARMEQDVHARTVRSHGQRRI
jgi:hypothetical protein